MIAVAAMAVNVEDAYSFSGSSFAVSYAFLRISWYMNIIGRVNTLKKLNHLQIITVRVLD
jgi:hypothetical protein